MTVTFEKEYGTTSGRRFARFFADDGRSAEIVMRDDRDSVHNWTRSDAKALATVHFLGRCAGRNTCPVTVHRA